MRFFIKKPYTSVYHRIKKDNNLKLTLKIIKKQKKSTYNNQSKKLQSQNEMKKSSKQKPSF